MSFIKKHFNTSIPRSTILPAEWNSFVSNDNVMFNNLDHFIFTVSKLKQKENEKCGMSYENALNKLKRRESDFPETQQESIRNLVRSNLLKRGLISEEVYENYKYSADGTNIGVDIGKFASGDSECVITPTKQYIDFFYEIYISISYPWTVTDEDVRTNVAKLLATIEELERQHIFIKINVVFADENATYGEDNPRNFLSIIPLFSHKDKKSVSDMSAVVNERLLRKFYFAVLEDLYGEKLSSGYGYPVSLEKAMNIGHEFNEIDFFEEVVNAVGA